MIENAPAMLPRIRVKLKVNKDCNNVRWKGRGPGESYIDSKEYNLFGIYKTTVDGLFTNYVKPQENGNRHDCKWTRFINDRGIGIMVVAENKFDFSSSYFEEIDLESAKHTINLSKRDYIVFNIDYMKNGLGSNSCGQSQLEKYRCKFDNFNLTFKLSVYNNKEISDLALVREKIITK